MNIFHRAFYAFMRTVIKPYFRLTGYSWERYDPESKNYLVLTNHNTNWDFFLFGLVLKKHMYFVASEHILRNNFTGRLIRFLSDPIPRRKGAAADETVDMILSRLKAGENVCMMAEGNRSYSGETGFISPRTAALVKQSGTGLITLTVHGGYFISPRWSKENRRGPSWGHVVREYTAQELASMTEEEIYQAIKSDLWVDAYADQKIKMAEYKCRHPAEGLESALFMCPECGNMSSMRTDDDRIFCASCGYSAKYNRFGFFEPDKKDMVLRHETVAQWYHAQLDGMKSFLSKAKESHEVLFYDEGITLSRVVKGNTTELLSRSRIEMTPEHLSFQCDDTQLQFKLTDINKISITQADIMFFTANGVYYEVRPANSDFSALKYLIASRLLIGKEYY